MQLQYRTGEEEESESEWVRDEIAIDKHRFLESFKTGMIFDLSV